MFCRIPCAKGWSELQENIRGRGGSQWIIRTGHVGAGALTRPAMRSIARRWRARLASPDEGVRAYVSRGGWGQERRSHKQKNPARAGMERGTLWIETSFTVGHPPGKGKSGPARPGAQRKDKPFPP